MISYRTAQSFQSKFGREKDERSGDWQVKKYLEYQVFCRCRQLFVSVSYLITYQGLKFLSRFDALTYVKITEQMDSHDIGRNRGGVAAALRSIRAKVMVMGIDSDVLYPLHEQEEIASLAPYAQLRVIRSMNGHDGFLLEQDQVSTFLRDLLDDNECLPTDSVSMDGADTLALGYAANCKTPSMVKGDPLGDIEVELPYYGDHEVKGTVHH